MDNFIAQIELLSNIHPYADDVAKASIYILILLIAFIPLSLVLWLTSIALDKTIGSLITTFNKTSEYLFHSARLSIDTAKKKLDKFYNNYSTMANYDNPSYKLSGHPIQEQIDKVQQELQEAPDILRDKNEKKMGLIKNLHSLLSTLSKKIKNLEMPTVPELELDKSTEIQKKDAKSRLYLFIPLLVAVMFVNSFLLNTFFDELLDGREIDIIDLPYSIFIAVMFTMIEAGIGVVFAFFKRPERTSHELADKTVIFAFGWFVIIGLACIEFILYFLVGTSEIDFDEVRDALLEGQWVEIFLMWGGWMSLLGPCIVFALYIFGHQVSTAYFLYTKYSDLERFKKDLDDRFNTIQGTDKSFNNIKDNTKNLLVDIKKENLVLEAEDTKSFKSKIEDFLTALKSQIKNLKEATNKAEKLEIPPPKIEVVKMNKTETESLLRKNVFYLAIILSSFFIFYSLFTNITVLEIDNIYFNLFLSLILISLSSVLGLLTYPKVKVYNTEGGGEIAKLVLQPLGISQKVIVFTLLGLLTVLGLYLFNINVSLDNIIYFLLYLFCIGACFFVGKNLLQSISSWIAFINYISKHFFALICNVIGIIIKIVSGILDFIIKIFNGLGYPAKLILGRTND
ncbi:hypothetical protein N9T15_01710 [Pelagibacteraceae bacterium]|nr:hypothetical protein [Pelagibacteraceae bacterium]